MIKANLVDKNQQKIVNTVSLSHKKITVKKQMRRSINIISMEHNNESQDEIVLFKFKRAYREESFDEIKIHSKKIKPNPESSQKAIEEYKRRHFIDRETMLAEMFQKLELRNSQTQGKSLYQQKQSKSQEEKKSLFFLKRVNLEEFPETQDQQSVKNEAVRIRAEFRKQTLQERLNKNRGILSQISEGDKKRVKYKIIDIRKQNFVELNGQKFEYEDLSQEFSAQEKLKSGTIYDYYVLKKGQITASVGYQPEIILPQEAQYLLEQENQPMNEETPVQSQEDSNREDRSDYDYPEEDYHEGDSDNQSEGIISGNRYNGSDYDDCSDDDEDLKNDYKDEDEEQYYRQYLKRCRGKQKGDDEITYLYNMKPAKYEDDSDQY